MDSFAGINSWEDRYRQIIQMGRELSPLPPQYKTDQYRVQGCQSQVWLHSRLSSEGRLGRFWIQADSDALIVKGLLAILLQIYSGIPLGEVLVPPTPSFWEKLQLKEHLSLTRSNGVHAILRQIYYDAHVLQLTQK